ncbi:MAG: hypothetical protein ACI4XW_11995 [Candidatus Spyradocola sp.]
MTVTFAVMLCPASISALDSVSPSNANFAYDRPYPNGYSGSWCR